MVEKISKLETAAISMKWVSNISLSLFCIIMYLGIQGYDNPYKICVGFCLLFFIIFVLTVIPSYIINFISDWKKCNDENIEEKDRKSKGKIVMEYLIPIFTLKGKIVMEYLIPIFTLIILYAWAKCRDQAPLYGESKTYNIFSIVGLGPIYLGEAIKKGTWIEMNGLNQNGGGFLSTIGSFILKMYTYILTTISIMTYIYGLSWITKTGGLIVSIISISSLIYTTLGKSILGYVPKNKELLGKNNLFFKFMQYRVYEDNWISKLGALIRRFTLLGLDTDALDKLIDTPEYNNILPRKSLEEYEKNRLIFMSDKKDNNVSFIEQWTWETLPYLYHWVILSFIGYILGGIFLIIMYGMK